MPPNRPGTLLIEKRCFRGGGDIVIAIHTAEVLIQIWRRLGGEVCRDEIEMLDISGVVTLLDSESSSWRTVRIRLSEVSEGHYPEDLMQACLDKAASWIREQSSQLKLIHSHGLQTQLLIDLWIDADQMEIRLPTELMSACVNAELEIYLLTND